MTVFVFDAYGTLLDVHSAVARHAGEIGEAAGRLSEIWRTKQLEYTWITSMAGRQESFWRLTQQSLDFAIASTGGVPEGVREKLLEAYEVLDAFAEVPATLKALRARGCRTGILSNGDHDMLSKAVKAAGIAPLLDHVLSVQDVGIFKPSGRVYRLVLQRFGVPKEEIVFVSSNRWDVAGAVAFGLRAVWINRRGSPPEYPGLQPSLTASDLSALDGVT